LTMRIAKAMAVMTTATSHPARRSVGMGTRSRSIVVGGALCSGAGGILTLSAAADASSTPVTRT
jgi:hypothetical protein